MRWHCNPTRSRRCVLRRRAFSLVECTIAVVLVGGLYVGVLQLVGSSRMTQFRFADRERGTQLAEALLAEIVLMPYEDPQSGGSTIGLDSGESATDRATFDDVDDYHGLAEPSPAERDGSALADASRFTRSAAVQWVLRDSPKTTSTSSTSVKRITVTVKAGTKVVAELVAYRSRTWPAAGDMTEVLR